MTNQQKQEQLELGVRKARNEDWYKFINKVNESERKFVAMPFWRSGVNVFAFVTLIFTIILTLVINLLWGSKISNQIPLFYSPKTGNWELYDQSFLFIFSLIVWIFNSIIFYLSYKLYSADRRLSMISNILVIISSAIFLVYVGQIFSLQLI